MVGGDARLDLDLSDPLRIAPGPSFRVTAHAGGAIDVVLRPLGDSVPATDLQVVFAPTPSVTLTAAGAAEVALRWLVTPGIELLVQLLGDALDTPLGTPVGGGSAPTLASLLEGAGVLDHGHVRAPLPEPLALLTGAVASIASTLSIEVADGVRLRVVADGTDVGIALTGAIAFAAGEWQPSLLFGGTEPGDGDGLVLAVLHANAGGGLGGLGWDVRPGITLDEVGVSLTRPGGLLQTDYVTIDGAAAVVGTGFTLDPSNGHVTVQPFTGEARVIGLGLPALTGGGGGENPVASSLIGDSSKEGAPVNPPLSFDVGWDGASLYIDIHGVEPGETLWIEVGKTFGPLHIDRIGVESGEADYTVDGSTVHTGYVGVAIDGGIAAGPLAIAVKGLAIQIPPRFASTPSTWPSTSTACRWISRRRRSRSPAGC